MIAYFARHATAANLLMLVILFLGVIGFTQTRRQIFPDFESQFIHVEIVYKGASPSEIEEAICSQVETAIEGIEGIKEVKSVAREGVGVVKIELLDSADPIEVMNDVEQEVDALSNLPDNAERAVVRQVEMPDFVISVSIASDRMRAKELLALAESIKDEMISRDDISLVTLSGMSEHRIRILVDRDALLAYGLTIDDVARQVGVESFDLPAGSIETDEREVKLRVVDQRRTAEDFRDLPIFTRESGAEIPLRSLARVEDTFENEWRLTRLNGERSVTLNIDRGDDEDTIRTAQAVRDYVASKRPKLPPGVEIEAWNDMSLIVSDRLDMLIRNLWQGALLVFLSLWLFLNVRLSFWIAWGIVVSFLGTLFLMFIFGYTIDMLTMVSLILAVGLVVDDAIVIGENIYVHQRRGKNPVQASIDGTLEVGVGVIASMITTVAILLPFFMLTGEMGKIVRVLPFGIIAALGVSLIEGFLILPNHLAHASSSREPNRIRTAIDKVIHGFIQRVYRPALVWVLGHRAVSLAGVVTLLLMSVGLMASGRILYRPMAELDGDVLVARLILPDGTDISRTQRIVERIESSLAEVNEHFKPRQPDQQDLIQLTSTTMGENFDADEVGSHTATVMVELLSTEVRDATCDEIIRMWREKIGEVPDAVSVTIDQYLPGPGGKPFEIQLQGQQYDRLKQVSLQLQGKLRDYPGVINMSDDLRAGREEFSIHLKGDARAMGVTAQSLANQLRGAFWGSIAQQYQRGEDTFTVEVRYDRRYRGSLGDLDNFKVMLPDGTAVPFHEVATLTSNRRHIPASGRETSGDEMLDIDFARRPHVGGKRTVTISADIDPEQGNAEAILTELERTYFPQLQKEYPDVAIVIAGQRKETKELYGRMYFGFATGLVIVYVLLSFVFKSYVEPVIVMLAIPFGMIGVLLGHWAFSYDWSDLSQFGFMMLAGIVVNDSIVLVEFIKNRLREGKPLEQAVVEAGCQRFRPVVLTSMTTFMGLMPLLMERSLQAQVLKPLPLSLACGVLFATVLILLLVPALYSIVADLGWGQKVGVADEAEEHTREASRKPELVSAE
ncbi:MAG: efflux RND transporter permease subunit [Pirellulaceae bacterium]